VDHLKDLSLDGMVILIRFFKKQEERVELSQLAHGSCEYGNELLVSINGAQFID
jgi:hypothetical protein